MEVQMDPKNLKWNETLTQPPATQQKVTRQKPRHRKKTREKQQKMLESRSESQKKRFARKRCQERIELVKKAQSTFKFTSLDGCLAFPQYGILVLPNMMKETTHALGTQCLTKEKGVYHGVITPETAATISMEDFHAHPKSLSITGQKSMSISYLYQEIQLQQRMLVSIGLPTDGYWKRMTRASRGGIQLGLRSSVSR